jgi:electron transfer flavoprotein beta subunit
MLIVAALRGSATGAGTDAADGCALEHALRLADAFGARCVAVAQGPPETGELLREALAAGADAVLRIEGPDPARSPAEDGDRTARMLLRALRDHYGDPDLVVGGAGSPDRGGSAAPAFLAARTGAAQALGLVELRPADDGPRTAGPGLRAVRRLDGGRRERLSVPLPAVCSVEPGGVRLRRAALPALLAARRAAVPAAAVPAPPSRVQAGPVRPYRPRARFLAVPQDPDPRRRVLAITGGAAEGRGPGDADTVRRVVTPADPGAAADEILRYLHRHGYLKGDQP